jgi:hypothetical protein
MPVAYVAKLLAAELSITVNRPARRSRSAYELSPRQPQRRTAA